MMVVVLLMVVEAGRWWGAGAPSGREHDKGQREVAGLQMSGAARRGVVGGGERE